MLTAFWQRPLISRVYWAGMRRLRDAFALEGVTVRVYAGLSPGDEPNHAMASQTGTVRVTAPNAPLSRKLNALSRAAGAWRPDYTLLLDSDDLLSDGMAHGYADLMRDGVAYTGLRDCYVYDIATDRLGYWPGVPDTSPRAHQAACIGRLWSYAVAERMGWQLWPDSTRRRGLGWLSAQRLLAYHVPLASVSCAALGGVALDCKSETNLWSYNALTLEPADRALLDAFPELRLPVAA